MKTHGNIPVPVEMPVSIRQHTSAYVSIRQHTSAYVSIRQHTLALEIPVKVPDERVSIRHSIRQHTSAYARSRDTDTGRDA